MKSWQGSLDHTLSLRSEGGSKSTKSFKNDRQKFDNKSIATMDFMEATVPPELEVEDLIMRFNLNAFEKATDFERNVILMDLNAIDLLRSVELLHNEIATVRTENHILQNYLEQNDPKMLIGLRKRELSSFSETVQKRQSAPGSSLQGAGSTRSSLKRSVLSLTFSIYGVGTRKKLSEAKLNYKAKAEMTEKAKVSRAIALVESEAEAMKTLRDLRSHVEEFGRRTVDVLEFEKNFHLQFLEDENSFRLLNSKSPIKISVKWRKFVKNLLKQMDAMMQKMRLQISTDVERSRQLRQQMVTKEDMSNITREADFEKLQIVRDDLLTLIDESTAKKIGLKLFSASAAANQGEESSRLRVLESECKVLHQRCDEVKRSVKKLERETQKILASNKRDQAALAELAERMKKFRAPNIGEYIDGKEEFGIFQREEKALNRKIHIAIMTMTNLENRQKRK